VYYQTASTVTREALQSTSPSAANSDADKDKVDTTNGHHIKVPITVSHNSLRRNGGNHVTLPPLERNSSYPGPVGIVAKPNGDICGDCASPSGNEATPRTVDAGANSEKPSQKQVAPGNGADKEEEIKDQEKHETSERDIIARAADQGDGEAKSSHDPNARLSATDVLGPDGTVIKRKKRRKQRTPIQMFFYKFERLAKSDGLSNFILTVIVLNTVVMAIDHDCDLCTQAYCPGFKGSLEVLNVLFAAIFVFEAAVKIIGLGPWEYFTSLTHLFDLVIVIVSCVEIPTVLDKYACLTQNTSGLSLEDSCARLESCESGGAA
jgi:hypothetical protein